MEQTTTQDKAILSLLCNDLYYKIKNIVNKYAYKQTEKDLVNAEETLIRVVYRDFVDNDIFGDFGILFLDDFFVINTFKKSVKGDKQSLSTAIEQIVSFMKSEQAKSQIKAVCSKYNQESKAERILSESIRKIGIYIPQLDQEECDSIRNTIMRIFKQILIFSANTTVSSSGSQKL